MDKQMVRRSGTTALLLLAITIALSLGVAMPARAQEPATCDGLPATVFGATPGLIEGTPADDVILGTAGDDLIEGHGGNDLICGGQGHDTIRGGDGDDRARWDVGDGDDRVFGQAGNDTLVFTGGNGHERIALERHGHSVQLTRNLAEVALVLRDIEAVRVKPLDGADELIVGDLTGSGVAEVAFDLGTLLGGGESKPDTIALSGTGRAETVEVVAQADGVDVLGLPTYVSLHHLDGLRDRLVIETLAGDDTVTAAALADDTITLVVDAGRGDDEIFVGRGMNILNGGAGFDTVHGNSFNDIIWNAEKIIAEPRLP